MARDLQKLICDHLAMLPEDAEITTDDFRHLLVGQLSVINKAIRRLELKGVLEFSHDRKTARGGQATKVWVKPKYAKISEFPFGVIKDGVFADLFIKPVSSKSGRIIKLLDVMEEY